MISKNLVMVWLMVPLSLSFADRIHVHVQLYLDVLIVLKVAHFLRFLQARRLKIYQQKTFLSVLK